MNNYERIDWWGTETPSSRLPPKIIEFMQSITNNKKMAIKKLLHNLVVVAQEEMDDLEKGGLSIPASSEDTPRYGTVINAGEGCTTVKTDDKVLWRAGAGEDIFIDNVPHLLMTEKDVIAIV